MVWMVLKPLIKVLSCLDGSSRVDIDIDDLQCFRRIPSTCHYHPMTVLGTSKWFMASMYYCYKTKPLMCLITTYRDVFCCVQARHTAGAVCKYKLSTFLQPLGHAKKGACM
jgi:hypothetical protein